MPAPSSMPTSGVRLARVSDADAMADLMVRSWRGRFAAILPDAALAAMDADDIAAVWASGILNPPSAQHRVLVAVHDEVVLGYAAVGTPQDPDASPGEVELVGLEVDPTAYGQGHGSRLMAAAVDVSRAGGALTAQAWCALADEPRRAFLQSAGWGPDTAYRDVVVGEDPAGEPVLVREVRLVTDLSEA